jgi:4-amino-4-deoxy-L-arabinose transferase-like glycosyltransferase
LKVSRVSVSRGASFKRWDRFALISVLVGAVARIVWGLIVHSPVDYRYSDMNGYVERAQRLASGIGLWRGDAFWPPGTHILLAAPMTLFGTGGPGMWAGAVLWCAFSISIPFFAWRLARLLLTPPAAALTALFCALWPLYITYGGYFTSETPSLALLLASLWAGYGAIRLSGRRAVWLGLAAGVLGGVAAANRPQLVLNLAVLVVPLLFHLRRQAMAFVGIVAGIALILGGVVLHNSVAADKLTGLSENAGVNFWMGHCDVHDVKTVDPATNLFFGFGNPVWAQTGRGGSYYFEGRLAWDQGFFYKLGLRCIERDGLGHVRILARSVVDMTATTIPWPQVDGTRGVVGTRDVVRVSNLAYSLLLPLVVIYSIFMILRQRGSGELSGEAVMLLQLACVLVVAVVFFGDPRLRSSYDVFGLALLAACIADLFRLEDPKGKRAG